MTLPTALVERLLRLTLAEDKIQKDVHILTGEFLRVFVSEALQRACLQAEKDGRKELSCSDLERILPQLLLDFG
ncbi:hypothetical protein PAPYR_4933 [Paratrimastix pyriformis]|uniref:Centromere protein X n=1 Tax=Paratrimastix pyriformis TaxID=342808 RepID=A0ABQ8UIT0_9EUKA|nr:hypothetical protein PAPYR_4933 [Paratrimastix pyriformis]